MSSILPINERKQFDLRYHSSKVFYVRFLGELKIPKRHFKINWPLVISLYLLKKFPETDGIFCCFLATALGSSSLRRAMDLVALSAIFFCCKYFLTLKTKTIFSRNFHCSAEKKDEKRLARLDIRWKESAGSPMIVSPQIFCRILWECSVHKSDLIFVEQKVKGGTHFLYRILDGKKNYPLPI